MGKDSTVAGLPFFFRTVPGQAVGTISTEAGCFFETWYNNGPIGYVPAGAERWYVFFRTTPYHHRHIVTVVGTIWYRIVLHPILNILVL